MNDNVETVGNYVSSVEGKEGGFQQQKIMNTVDGMFIKIRIPTTFIGYTDGEHKRHLLSCMKSAPIQQANASQDY